MTIWKFPMNSISVSIKIPIGAKILTLQEQGGIPCIWALVHPGTEEEIRHFRFFGTGEPMSDLVHIDHIGTWQKSGLVFHLFELEGESK